MVQGLQGPEMLLQQEQGLQGPEMLLQQEQGLQAHGRQGQGLQDHTQQMRQQGKGQVWRQPARRELGAAIWCFSLTY
jgi:hypothetical protein